MARADLAIGAGGSSHWERCALGLPALVVAVAPNQIPSSRHLHDLGACRFLGEGRLLRDGDLRRALEAFRQAPDTRTAMSRAAQSILPDPHGAPRVAQSLLQQVPL